MSKKSRNSSTGDNVMLYGTVGAVVCGGLIYYGSKYANNIYSLWKTGKWDVSCQQEQNYPKNANPNNTHTTYTDRECSQSKNVKEVPSPTHYVSQSSPRSQSDNSLSETSESLRSDSPPQNHQQSPSNLLTENRSHNQRRRHQHKTTSNRHHYEGMKELLMALKTAEAVNVTQKNQNRLTNRTQSNQPKTQTQAQSQAIEEYSILASTQPKPTAIKALEDVQRANTQKDILFPYRSQSDPNQRVGQDAEVSPMSKHDQIGELNALRYMLSPQYQTTPVSKNGQAHGSSVINVKHSEKNVPVINNPEYDNSEIDTHPIMIAAKHNDTNDYKNID